jgi:hypothetical protein
MKKGGKTVVEGFLASREEGEDLIEWRLMCVGHPSLRCMHGINEGV